MPARNTLVQLLALYTNPESQHAQRHRQTAGPTDGWTDRRQDYANSQSCCVAARSAKNTTTSPAAAGTDRAIIPTRIQGSRMVVLNFL